MRINTYTGKVEDRTRKGVWQKNYLLGQSNCEMNPALDHQSSACYTTLR